MDYMYGEFGTVLIGILCKKIAPTSYYTLFRLRGSQITIFFSKSSLEWFSEIINSQDMIHYRYLRQKKHNFAKNKENGV